jgi:hypothetical protein
MLTDRPVTETLKDCPYAVAVIAWITDHAGGRIPVHQPGAFTSYATSRASACWGQPLDGTPIPGTPLRIAVSCPSPMQAGSPLPIYFDVALISE